MPIAGVARGVPGTPTPAPIPNFHDQTETPPPFYNDAAVGEIDLSGSAVESFGYSDTGTGTITLAGSSTQTLTGDDVRSASLTLSGVIAAQDWTGTTSRSGTVTLSAGAQSESNVQSGASDSVDRQSIEFTLSGSATSLFTQSSSRSGTITLSGARSDTATHSAAPAGTTTLAGSGTDSASHTGATSATFTIGSLPSLIVGAYPGLFYPGEAYPGQRWPFTDTRTDAAAGTISASGSSSESYTTGSPGFHDAGSGTIGLTGAADELYIAPPPIPLLIPRNLTGDITYSTL